jgi:hypothetical protein
MSCQLILGTYWPVPELSGPGVFRIDEQHACRATRLRGGNLSISKDADRLPNGLLKRIALTWLRRKWSCYLKRSIPIIVKARVMLIYEDVRIAVVPLNVGANSLNLD